MVSLNLAIFNLLPIPILDGGVILMLFVEMVMQRRPQPQREGGRVQGRFCRHYGDCGIRHLQRHLANPAGRLIHGMHCTSIRQSDLPHTSRLVEDVLYHLRSHGRLLPASGFADLGAFQDAARAKIQFPPDRRAALVAALRLRNPASASLDRLAQPGTLAVLTGQQVGLFSAARPTRSIRRSTPPRLAEWLTANGPPGRAGLLAGHLRRP